MSTSQSRLLCGTICALIAFASSGAWSQTLGKLKGSPIDEDTRPILVEILTRSFSDSLDNPVVAACLEVGRRGDDIALYSLIAIDEGRRVVSEESDFVTRAFSEGASLEEIYQMRKSRATRERVEELYQAMQKVTAGQDYCQSILDTILGG